METPLCAALPRVIATTMQHFQGCLVSTSKGDCNRATLPRVPVPGLLHHRHHSTSSIFSFFTSLSWQPHWCFPTPYHLNGKGGTWQQVYRTPVEFQGWHCGHQQPKVPTTPQQRQRLIPSTSFTHSRVQGCVDILTSLLAYQLPITRISCSTLAIALIILSRSSITSVDLGT